MPLNVTRLATSSLSSGRYGADISTTRPWLPPSTRLVDTHP